MVMEGFILSWHTGWISVATNLATIDNLMCKEFDTIYASYFSLFLWLTHKWRNNIAPTKINYDMYVCHSVRCAQGVASLGITYTVNKRVWVMQYKSTNGVWAADRCFSSTFSFSLIFHSVQVCMPHGRFFITSSSVTKFITMKINFQALAWLCHEY